MPLQRFLKRLETLGMFSPLPRHCLEIGPGVVGEKLGYSHRSCIDAY